MKLLFFLAFLLNFQLIAADLDTVKEKLLQELEAVNEQLNQQRTKVFEERADVRLKVTKLSKHSQESVNSVDADRQQVARMIKEIETLESELAEEAALVKTINKTLVQLRREWQTLIPRQSALLYNQAFTNFDSSQNKVLELGSLSKSLVADGFKTLVTQTAGLNSKGLKKEGQLLSISHAVHYLVIGDEGGLAFSTTEHDVTSLKPMVGVAVAVKLLEKGERADISFDLTDGLAFEKRAAGQSFLEHLKTGGVIIYPLVFLALLGLATGIYKTLQLYLIRSTYDEQVNKLIGLIKSGELEAARTFVKGLKDPIKSLLNEALEHHQQSRENLEEVLNENILGQLPKLDRLLSVLSVTAGAAPLLGLLGTVMGIIKTFEMIAIYGNETANLAGGISEALVTTKVGLIVAIPALIWYAILNRRLKGIVGNLEKAMLGFINAISLKGGPRESSK